jgi:hypothetical protein
VIEESERELLDELRKQVACERKFVCVNSAFATLCEGKYHTDLDLLECLEKSQATCKFARPFGCTLVCTCPLRRLIAKNFDRWSAEATAVLREDENPLPPA